MSLAFPYMLSGASMSQKQLSHARRYEVIEITNYEELPVSCTSQHETRCVNGRPRIVATRATTQTRSHLTWRGEPLDFCLDTA